MNWRRFLNRAQADAEQQEELESYLEITTEEYIAQGMGVDEARLGARRKLGNLTRIREEVYEMNTATFIDTTVQELRHALRRLRLNPAFSITAILTLALGIGADTAVFSVVNKVLIQPLNYPKPEQLAALRQLAPGAAGLASFSDGLPPSPSMYVTYSEHNQTFQSLGIWNSGTANVTGLAEPEQVRIVSISDGVLQALDVPPAVGRSLLPDDYRLIGAPDFFGSGFTRTVLLSYGYWKRRFGGDKSAIGRTIRVDERPREIAGVMPQGFRMVNAEFDLIVPLAFDRSRLTLGGFGFNGVGRLKSGVTVTQANADLARLVPAWMDSWTNGPGTNSHVYESWKITPALRSLKEEVVGSAADVLWVVMATIALVMLIACANVANLLLVRAEVRQQELAVRAALGAGRGRIARSLLVESVMLGLLGGIAGVALADGGLRLLLAIGPANLPRLNEISLSPSSLAFALGLSVLSGLAFGLIPALKYTGSRISSTLQSVGRALSLSRERHRTRSLLVVAQVAVALVLLVSAGLMIRTFQALRTVEPGFTHPERLQIVRIFIPPSLVADAERVTRIQNEIQDKLAAISGVESAGFASQMPMEGFEPNWDAIQAEDKPNTGNKEIPPLRFFKNISPGYLGAVGTRIVAGRDLTWNETYGSPQGALVSEDVARELWGSAAAALGKRVRQNPRMPWHEVVGVVQEVHERGLDQKPPAIVYWPVMIRFPFGSVSFRTVTFVIRSDRTGTEGFLKQIQQAVWSVNASLPVAGVRTMQEVYDRSLARTSFTLVMLAIAGAMALVLGVVGIYGVIAYAVSQRRREIGIRLALGAQSGEVQRAFVRQALLLASVGIAIGLAGAAGLTGLMKSLLFGVGTLDPLTYAAMALLLAGAAALASYLPARRAAAVDPVEALRAE